MLKKKMMLSRASHELPEYFWKPTLRAVDAALAGTNDAAIDVDPRALEYRFFVSTVLEKGVPGSMRAAFEDAMAALPAGFVRAPDVASLLKDFGGVAEAYTPQQWERAFASRGLSARAFGWFPASGL